MKTKFLMLLTVPLVAMGMTGCIDSNRTRSDNSPKTISKKVVKNNKQSQYRDFTQSEFDKIRGNKKFVVFFHANWCGTCQKWEKKILNIVDSLPADTVILKADYDTEKDLAKKLHVKSQSSAVFFDAKGEITDTIMDPSMEKITSFFTEKTANIFKTEKFQPYSAESREKLAGEKYLIFFYADWCGTCRKWQKNVLANLDSLPENTRILKANYDSDLELKKEFKITMQSTAVFMNEDGTFEIKTDPSVDILKEFFSK